MGQIRKTSRVCNVGVALGTGISWFELLEVMRKSRARESLDLWTLVRQTPASLHRTSVWRILDGEQACVHETRDQINVFMYPTLWTLSIRKTSRVCNVGVALGTGISWFELLEVMRKSSE
ncbi:hypothetical protein F2P79_009601 [Pimephales promelas]|nr:hypothetical protein F2P79_009601 [Pimephales promelas]